MKKASHGKTGEAKASIAMSGAIVTGQLWVTRRRADAASPGDAYNNNSILPAWSGSCA